MPLLLIKNLIFLESKGHPAPAGFFYIQCPDTGYSKKAGRKAEFAFCSRIFLKLAKKYLAN